MHQFTFVLKINKDKENDRNHILYHSRNLRSLLRHLQQRLYNNKCLPHDNKTLVPKFSSTHNNRFTPLKPIKWQNHYKQHSCQKVSYQSEIDRIRRVQTSHLFTCPIPPVNDL